MTPARYSVAMLAHIPEEKTSPAESASLLTLFLSSLTQIPRSQPKVFIGS